MAELSSDCPKGSGENVAAIRAWSRTARDEDPEGTQVNDWPGIAAITLFVEDLDAARTFYKAAFGLPIHFEDPHSVVFKFGDTLLNLLVEPAVPKLISPAAVRSREADAVVLTITVDDVDAACLELADKGVDLLNGPMDRPWGIRTASFIDPDLHLGDCQVVGVDHTLASQVGEPLTLPVFRFGQVHRRVCRCPLSIAG